MATYKVKENFKGSPDGMQVIEFTKGEVVELAGDLEVVALEEGWVAKTRKTPAQVAAEKAEKEAAELAEKEAAELAEKEAAELAEKEAAELAEKEAAELAEKEAAELAEKD